jgi:phenylacetate-CoA ligase
MALELSKAAYDRMPALIQETLLSLRGRRLRRRRFGALYREMRETLRRNETGSRDAVLAVQRHLLRRLITRAASEVPYYRAAFAEAEVRAEEIRGPRDLKLLPLLPKDTVRARKEELVSERFPRRALLHGHTSGTTGSSLTLYWDANVDIVSNAVLWRHREWAGVSFGQPYATLLGQLIVPPSQKDPPFWRFNRPWNQLFLSSFHMKAENLDSYVDAMERYEVQALEAYPSTAYVLARHLAAQGRTVPLRAVFTSTEPLLDIQREVIEERFACPVFDYLGAAERVVFAGECSEHRGLHLFDEYGVTEILDDDGEPVPAGCPGRLVVTGLHNFAMPLIRYEIGDVSGIQVESCPCGRPLPLLLPITSKAEDLVVLPDGRFISGSVLTHPFKPMTHIAESQIIQEELGRIRIKVVPRPGYDEGDQAKLLASLRERLGNEIRLEIERVETIPREARGKFRWVVSKVPLRFGQRSLANLYTRNTSSGEQ